MICAECRFEADCETLKNIPGIRGCGHGEPKVMKTESGEPPIPEGYKEIKDVDGVFVSDNEIVVTGMPDEDSEHDCDDMGCTSVSHVLFRTRIGGTQ